MRLIQAKLKGKAPRRQERDTPQQADVVDLMARLRASLEAKGGTAVGKPASKAPKKPAARKKKRAA